MRRLMTMVAACLTLAAHCTDYEPCVISAVAPVGGFTQVWYELPCDYDGELWDSIYYWRATNFPYPQQVCFEKSVYDCANANRAWIVLADSNGVARTACLCDSNFWARIASVQVGGLHYLTASDFTAAAARELWRAYKSNGPRMADGMVITVK